MSVSIPNSFFTKEMTDDSSAITHITDTYTQFIGRSGRQLQGQELKDFVDNAFKHYKYINSVGSAGSASNYTAVANVMSDVTGKTYSVTIDEALQMLMYRNCFWASVAAGICRRAVIPEMCDTLAIVVNPERSIGVELIYNPEFFKTLKSIEHFMFVLEHELVHVVAQHIQRFWAHRLSQTLQGKTTDIFNTAADFADNSLIIKHYKKDEQLLRASYLFPERANLPRDLSLEEYLKLLEDPKYDEKLKEMQNFLVNKHMWDKKVGEDGSVKDATTGDMSQAGQKNKMNFPEFINKAIEDHERKYGSIGADLHSFIEEFVQPERPPSWDELLKSELATGYPNSAERTIMRFSRRKYADSRMSKFPGKKTTRGYKIVFIVDTSGSVTDKDLQLAAGLAMDLLQHHQNWELYYVQADTDIQFFTKVVNESDITLEAHGRGGTDFIKPLEWVETEIGPDIVVYFTDGYGPAPLTEPRFKVVWMLPSNCKAPANWGRAIEVV